MTRVVTTSKVGNSGESKGLLELQPDDKPWGESKAKKKKYICNSIKNSTFLRINHTLKIMI